MLSYALAIAVAISSLVLFSTAFLMSDIHRQDDFLWSAVGLIYALVLWFCARNITGAVLLGQASASILLVSYSWQTLKLRKAVAHPERASEINNFSILKAVNGLLTRFKSQPKVAVTPSVTDNPKVTDSEIAIPDTASTNAKPNKPGVLNKLFNKKKSETVADIKEDLLKEPESPPVTPEVPQPETTPDVPAASEQTTTVTTDEPVIGTIESSESSVEEVNRTKVSKPTTSVDSIAGNTAKKEIKPVPAPEPAIIKEPKTEVLSQQENIVKSESTAPVTESQEPKAIANSTQDVVPVPPPNQTDLARVETTSESITETVEDIKQEVKQPVEQPKPPRRDALDSLETVEVAEILEAIPEDRSNQDDSDRNNIIEVTTTEIDAIAPQQKPEQKPDLDNKPNSDSEPE